jgi:hypothetical protein
MLEAVEVVVKMMEVQEVQAVVEMENKLEMLNQVQQQELAEVELEM